MLSLDVLKCFTIFLVVWGHSLKYFTDVGVDSLPVYRYIYAVHMPLFMMLSGYFAVSSMASAWGSFLSKKARQLLLPCVVWLVIIWMLGSVYRREADFGMLLVLLKDGLWFLKSCFICYVLAYAGHRLRLPTLLSVVLTLIVSQMVCLYAVSTMYPCFIVGMSLRSRPVFFKWTGRHWGLLMLLFVAMLFFWTKPWDNTGWLYWLCRLYRIVMGIVGSLAFIGLFSRYVRNDTHNRLFILCGQWGQYTLGIYILQTVILEGALKFMIDWTGMNYHLYNFVATPLVSLAVMLACIGIYRVLCRNRTTAFWLFGK